MRSAYRPARAVPLAAAMLATLALPAFAQGTPEQREACAPDAVRLCPDTIPDVGRTKACMMAHEAELSPRCHTAFLGATTPRRRVARATPMPAPAAAAPAAPEMTVPGIAIPDIATPDIATPDIAMPKLPAFGDVGSLDVPDTTDASTARDARHARVVVGRLCRESVLDPNTCAFTNRMIDLAR